MIIQGAVLGAFIVLMVAAAKWAFAYEEEPNLSSRVETDRLKINELVWEHRPNGSEEVANKWVGNGIEIIANPQLIEPPIYISKGDRLKYRRNENGVIDTEERSDLYIYNLDSAIKISVKDSRFKTDNVGHLMDFLVQEKIIIADDGI